ncbi:relaxase domain-containing protein [Nostoc punctiforme FACHB-252]|uniref:Relaxase domain-containing protein n=1 Tax=Nostoc punctiforme FACHB-252 TaxID=1357509 RepID=A0ABR8HLJ4_NOSPU|nr:MobF family relaxase [Nostoc punctiforme]MBD2615955.1 relaxase domain-containing protein [Nostoc punctiforme FACHB-252]
MLTSANVSSQMAVNYFIKNYYHQGKSRWSGEGAVKLGLSGAVDNEQAFKNVISGLTPDGKERLNARVLKPQERRAALDCTFSAPKSVSLMALVGGDSRLIAAHHKALESVLDLMEQRYACTRVSEPDSRQRANTGNLVVAKFDHIESRSLDPHLHTHCLLMNMTQTLDGKWMSLVNSEIFANKKFLGMAYQSYLASEVQKLGYEVEQRNHGQFEIKGFKEQDLVEFSKRRQQIIAAVGVSSSWSEREKVWDTTRQRKQKISEDELKSLWLEEAAALGISFVKPREPRPQQAPEVISQKSLLDALDDAIGHCSQRNVAFKQEDLEKFILEERLACDVRAIEPLIKEHQELITLPGLERQYTTWAAVNTELATIELMQLGLGKVNSISQQQVVENYLQKTQLNQGQRQAVQLAATTQDQFIAWQGVAGAGKTFALKELKAIATNSGYLVKGFAPSSAAAKVLSEELQIQSETVARLLVSESPREIEPDQIWIVDEAGLLSAKDAYALLQRAMLQQARVILVGDTRQLSAVEAGNPFKSLQQAGIGTAYMNESNRQKDPQLKLAIDLIADGRVKAGFERLEANGSIVEVDSESKAEAIANGYMAADPTQRAKTLVLAGTNTEKFLITQAIRDKLKDEGSLGKTALVTQLQTKNLSIVQMRFAHNFEIGDVVIPTRDYKRRGLSKGKLYEVVGQTTDGLTLKSDDGKHLEVDTAFEKAVYQRQEIEIAVGEILQWKKNDRKLGRRNGQEFVVTAIAVDKAQIQYLNSDRTEEIDLSLAQTLDYALVSTTYSSQGKTADRVLISADFTIGQESFYVAASRARHELKIYTEDGARLVELAQQSKAKENALELLLKQVRSSIGKQRQGEQQQQITINIDACIEEPVLKQQTVVEVPVVQPVFKLVAPSVITSLEASTEASILSEHGQTEALEENPIEKSQGLRQPTKPILPELRQPAASSAKPLKKAEGTSFKGIQAPPDHIDPEHWEELVDKSAIHPDIAALNFKSLHLDPIEQEHQAWEHLMYSDKISRRNDGRLLYGDLIRYAHIESGGWWCNAGVDPRSFSSLQSPQKPTTKIWGCYKPNAPRNKVDEPGKFIKYEHPPKADLSIFLLDVPEQIANRIYSKARVNPTNSDRQSGFWYCVWKYNVPVTIAEGAKKAASLLSQGHAAIGLPGIYAGYRSKDDQGYQIKARLHEELAVFATPVRDIKFCFDYETKPKTKQNIEIAISRTGRLLEQQGAKVSVVTLPGPDKGVDDFIVEYGSLAYEKLSFEAIGLREWQKNNQELRHSPPSPPKLLSSIERKQRQADKFNNDSQYDNQKLESEIQQKIKFMDSQELASLVLEVANYFKNPYQENDPQTLKMKVIRQVIRSQKEEIIEKLSSNEQEVEIDPEQQIRFRR